jgi:mannose-6-phosphate isomerase
MIPILLQPVYKENVWGGDRLKTLYGRDIPGDHTGESWDVTCRARENNIVLNGERAGETLQSLIDSDRAGILGSRVAAGAGFPLLYKIIDAQDDLSIQVHPDDKYALEVEHLPYGKTETWFILRAPKDAELCIGMADGVTREQLENALKTGECVTDCFGRLPVSPGDVIHIPAGLVHAITSGIMLIEIQQNSDTTYRVFDYNRKGLDGQPRELHISDALAVIDFGGRLKKQVTKGLSVKNGGFSITYAVANPNYAIEIITAETAGQLRLQTDSGTFSVLSCVSGSVTVSGGNETVTIAGGGCVFLPAALGEYKIGTQGPAKLLRSYVPDIERDFIQPLSKSGYSPDEIESECSIQRGLS